MGTPSVLRILVTLSLRVACKVKNPFCNEQGVAGVMAKERGELREKKVL